MTLCPRSLRDGYQGVLDAIVEAELASGALGASADRRGAALAAKKVAVLDVIEFLDAPLAGGNGTQARPDGMHVGGHGPKPNRASGRPVGVRKGTLRSHPQLPQGPT